MTQHETNCRGVSPEVTGRAERYMGGSGLVSGRVTDAGGGEVRLLLDRDTEAYPEVGEHVIVLRMLDYSSRHPYTCAYCPQLGGWRTPAGFWTHMAATHPGLPAEPPR